MGPPVTDAMTANYWQWAIGLTSADFTAGHVITTDPGGSGVAFLMDPRDGPTKPAVTGSFAQTVSLSAGMLSSHQPILIPLWIGCADNTDGMETSSLNVTDQIHYLLGNIKSHVKINNVDVFGLNPFLNVDVCEINLTTVTFHYNPPSETPGTTLYQATTTFPAHSFNFTVLATSHKYINQIAGMSNWTLGFHPFATSSGLWAVISPSDRPGGTSSSTWSIGDKISYDTTVAANTPGLGCTGTPHTFGPVTITYTVTA